MIVHPRTHHSTQVHQVSRFSQAQAQTRTHSGASLPRQDNGRAARLSRCAWRVDHPSGCGKCGPGMDVHLSVDGSRSCIHCSLLWLPPQAQVRVKLQEKAERRGYPDPAIMRCSIVGRMAEGKVQSRPHYVDRLSTDTSRLRSGGPLQSRQRPSCAPSCAVLAHANNLAFHLRVQWC